MNLKARVFLSAAAGFLAAAFPAAAQSSGNFSATATSAACAIGAGGTFSGGTGVQLFSTNISTSNGSGVTLDIRPSLVTGLFTDTKISTSIPSASADVGIQVCVTVDGKGDAVLPASCVVYDERFQQISSQLFSQLSECALNDLCNFDLILSTLSAHNYDFVVPVGQGKHVVQATWSVIGAGASNGNASVASCVGPGILTVTQEKVFNNSGALLTF